VAGQSSNGRYAPYTEPNPQGHNPQKEVYQSFTPEESQMRLLPYIIFAILNGTVLLCGTGIFGISNLAFLFCSIIIVLIFNFVYGIRELKAVLAVRPNTEGTAESPIREG